MKIARLAALILVAALAMGLVVASVASAAGPEFKFLSGTTTAKITGTSGTSILEATGEKVSCGKSEVEGATTSTTLFHVTIHYLECEGTNGINGKKCPVMSTGAPAENLILVLLIGHLGTVLPGGAAGALLTPASGKTFVTLLPNSVKCIPETKVTGSVAGLVEPTGKFATTGKIVLAATGGKENIKDIDLSNGSLVEPELVAFGSAATQTQTESLTFSPDIEVT